MPYPALFRRLWANRDGGVAMEFAFVAPPFVALVLGILHIALIYMAQEGLETAVENAARLVMTGAAQSMTTGTNSAAGMSATDFKSAVCSGISGKDSNGNAVTYSGVLPPFLTCDRLTVNVQVVPTGCTSPTITVPVYTYDKTTGKLTGTSAGYGTVSCDGTSTGTNGIGSTQGKLVIMQLAYLWPTVSGPLGVNFVNQNYGNNRLLVATYTFTVEQYLCPTDPSTGVAQTC
ncbi:TadE/TadG family type IV pilus assembly protein [Novosphingobium sp.]|uniref:TadE/TadG family type IV pilus assembly protein n=1 Tax=Novosphingobium sp. TaxID=1874826 RepID=UPI0031E0A5E2